MKAKHIIFNVVAYGQEAVPNPPKDVSGYQPPSIPARMLELLCTSFQDDGAHAPAQSITITNQAGIVALRDFCNELLGETK